VGTESDIKLGRERSLTKTGGVPTWQEGLRKGQKGGAKGKVEPGWFRKKKKK